MRQWSKLVLLLAWFAMAVPAMAVQKSGFDLSESLLPAHDVLQGGPPMDGIPALDHPKFSPKR